MRMKILVVDDDQDFLELAMCMLISLGYEDLNFALCAEDALDRIEEQQTPFDCFLLDIQMPGQNGIDLCRMIREMPQHAYTPILMVSAMSEKTYIDRAFKAGANDYVPKPIERIDIKARLNMVEALLTERRHIGLVNDRLTSAEAEFGRAFGFEDAVTVPEADWLIPYASLEKYVLRLGNMRLASSQAVGFHVENAPQLHAAAPGLEFLDIMSDVSRAILDAFPGTLRFLSYAGHGDFCAITSRFDRFDPMTAKVLINDHIELGHQDGADGWNVPRVNVGAGCRQSLLSFGDPTHLLCRAILDARHGLGRGFADTDFAVKEVAHAGR